MRISDWSSDVCSSDLTATRLHDLKRRLHATFFQPVLQPRQIAVDHWLHVGIKPRDHRALILAKSGVHFVRHGQGQRRIDRKSTRLNSVTNAHLVCRLLLDKKNNQNQKNSKWYTNTN